ncbi:MAG: hypothetical protein ABEJ44_05860 [Halanaeroarchaeum sp.]
MSLDEKAAIYHLLVAAGGSIAVLVAVVAIEATGISIIDPISAGRLAVSNV